MHLLEKKNDSEPISFHLRKLEKIFEEFKPVGCHTQQSACIRKRKITDVNAYMWNIEKWYR